MFSEIDHSEAPPRVTFPRGYNAAVDLLDRNVHEGRGDKIAIVDDRGRYTYAEVTERSNRVGNALKALGVLPEQRVLLVMLDTVDFVAVFLGAMKIGAVPVPVNTLLIADDYAYIAQDSRAPLVVVSDHLLPKVEAAIAKMDRTPPKVVTSSTPLGGDRGTHPKLEDLLAKASAELEVAKTTADDVAFWLYSSGSTGAPKERCTSTRI